jgi:hypothetical protein
VKLFFIFHSLIEYSSFFTLSFGEKKVEEGQTAEVVKEADAERFPFLKEK